MGEVSRKPRVSAITLGRAWAAHSTEVGLLVLAALPKSHPPAPGERVRLGLDQDAPAGGSFELPAVLLEVRITTKKFPGEAGRVERPQFLIRARRPPVGAAHRHRLHWQVADHSACREDTRDGGGSGTSRAGQRVLSWRQGTGSQLVRRASAQQVRVAVLGHPTGSRQWGVPGSACPIWFACRIDMEDDQGNVAP